MFTRIDRLLLGTLVLLLASGCTAGADACSGFVVTSVDGDNSFTVPELMAHATSMGMTQQEAETLIYLEGIESSATVGASGSLCIDGKPG